MKRPYIIQGTALAIESEEALRCLKISTKTFPHLGGASVVKATWNSRSGGGTFELSDID